MSQVLIDDLKKQIADGQAIAIVGAGVSMGATGNAPAASWSGLLKLGIERCVGLSRPMPPGRHGSGKRSKEAACRTLLEVAEAVSGRLGFPDDREWTLWLQDTRRRTGAERAGGPASPARPRRPDRHHQLRRSDRSGDGPPSGHLEAARPCARGAARRTARRDSSAWALGRAGVSGPRRAVLRAGARIELRPGFAARHGLLRDAALHWLRRGAERPELQRVAGVPGAVIQAAIATSAWSGTTAATRSARSTHAMACR